MSENKTLTPQQKFEEKIAERLKTDIGSLIPDDVLSELIAKQIDTIFNKQKRIPKPNRGSYSSDTILVLNDFHKKVLDLLTPRIETAIDSYFKDNNDAINKKIEEVVKTAAQKSFSTLVRGAIAGMAQGVTMGASMNLNQAMMNHQADFHNGQY